MPDRNEHDVKDNLDTLRFAVARNARVWSPRFGNESQHYCWVLRFQQGLIQEVREYMDTQLVTETFGPDEG